MKSRNNHGMAYTTLPAKGTKKRETLRLLLRRQGLTSKEALELDLIRSLFQFGNVIRDLTNYNGWDVRQFNYPTNGKVGAPEKIYKIVGRLRPNRYRSFIGDRS